jgi:hypothetical protein
VAVKAVKSIGKVVGCYDYAEGDKTDMGLRQVCYQKLLWLEMSEVKAYSQASQW